MAAKKIDTIDIEDTRENLRSMSTGITDLFEKMTDDHVGKDLEVLDSFPDFRRNMPLTYLERAKNRLNKKDYKIAFAGGFSAGKSTLINALLGMPDMLPTQAGECTMSITMVSNPLGGDQHIEVKYFTKEQALRYIYTTARYLPLLEKYRDEVLDNFSEEKAIEGIQHGADLAGKIPEHRVKKDELEEFIKYIDLYADRLGTVKIDAIDKADQFLTTDKQNRGLGHLMLIEQVHLYKDMALFKEKNCVIIDLPGSDSVNERQRQLSFDFLREADAIVMILGTRGLDANAQALWTELGRQYHDIKNKIFFVINMFDALPADQLKKDEIERVLKSQVIDQLINYNLDPSKLYLTSGLRQELTLRKQQGTISPAQLTQLEGINKDGTSKLQSLDNDIIPNIREKIVKCLENDDGGVAYLRNELLSYLERDIQIERLKEIFRDLEESYEPIVSLLSPFLQKYQRLATNKITMGQEVMKFFTEAKEKFVKGIQEIPAIIKERVPVMIEKMGKDLDKEVIRSRIGKENFFKITAKPGKSIKRIKEEILEQMKGVLSEEFADYMKNTVPAPITQALFQVVDDTKVGQIINKLSEQLDTDYGDKFQGILDDFKTTLEQFTYMRAIEETWPLQEADIEVPDPPHLKGWDSDKEKEFRKDMYELFKNQFTGLVKHLGDVLGRHYSELIIKLYDDIETLIDHVSDHVLRDPTAVALPTSMLLGETDDIEVKRERALIDYIERWTNIKEERNTVASALGLGE